MCLAAEKLFFKCYYKRCLFFTILIMFFECAAPCQPPGLNVTMSCTDNVASVRWSSSAGGQLYTVKAVSINGTLIDSCNGFDGSCDLRSLVCGLQYTATVVAQHSSCQSLPSPPTRIRTGEESPSLPPDLPVYLQEFGGDKRVLFKNIYIYII